MSGLDDPEAPGEEFKGEENVPPKAEAKSDPESAVCAVDFQWVIEDLSHQIRLNFTQYCRMPTKSIISDGHFVLVTGVIPTNDSAKRIHVARIDLPERDIEAETPLFDMARYEADKSNLRVESRRMFESLEMVKEKFELPRNDCLPLEQRAWVIISGAQFDNPKVFKRVHAILSGYETFGMNPANEKDLSDYLCALTQSVSPARKLVMPVGFIFMGDFSAKYGPKPHDLAHARLPTNTLWALKKYPHISSYLITWTYCYRLLSIFPRLLRECKFRFVPGPMDPGLPLMPRFAIPESLTTFFCKELQALVASSAAQTPAGASETTPDVEFVGNPLSIAYDSGSIQIVRANLSALVRSKQYALTVPNFTTSLPDSAPQAPGAGGDSVSGGVVAVEAFREAISSLLMSQGHSYPLPNAKFQKSAAVMNSADFVLWNDPLPNLVLIADSESPAWQNRVGKDHTIASLPGIGESIHSAGAWAIWDCTTNHLDILDPP